MNPAKKSTTLKLFTLLFLGLILVISLVACGGSASDSSAPESADSASSESAAPAVANGDIVAAFTFNNTGSVDFCQLYLSTVDKNDWGPDQLAGQKLPAGQSFTLKNIPAGQYDAKAVACEGGAESVIQVDIKN